MKKSFSSIAVLALFAFTFPGNFPDLYAADLPHSPDSPAPALSSEVSAQELEDEITRKIPSVAEFQFISNKASELGVRAWLFGGTAASFGHYVRWDLLRKRGDTRFQPHRFDYDYTNIFRSTQDADIVIDGNVEQATLLEKALKDRFDHLQGSKSAWEVRLLKQDRGDKQALLNNPDFMNQNTDSNSTGMIEITPPQNGDPLIRDLRDWNSRDSQFFKDIRQGKLHYYFSPLHETTRFYKEGRNPPILSAIRYLIKAVQFELTPLPQDLDAIRNVITHFDPRRDCQNAYVSNWLEKNGPKLFQNAVNFEYASNLLDSLGLRKKLIAVHQDPAREGSLAWWMSKEPLISRPVGIDPKTGHPATGQTARELGIDTVAHETRDFDAYDSITRSHTGEPNVFKSREGAPGELAAFGDGFYTAKGRKGAKGTGITIRFKAAPDAREGVDFSLASKARDAAGKVFDGEYVIWKNRKALTVIPESLNITPAQYFELLSNGFGFDPSDRGIAEQLRRRVTNKSKNLSDREIHSICEIVKGNVASNNISTELVKEWYKLPASSKFPLPLKGSDYFKLLWSPGMHLEKELLDFIVHDSHLKTDVTDLSHKERKELGDFITQRFQKLTFKEYADRNWQFINKNIFEEWLKLPESRTNPDPVMAAIARTDIPGMSQSTLMHIFEARHRTVPLNPVFLHALSFVAKQGIDPERVVNTLKNTPEAVNHPLGLDIIGTAIELPYYHREIAIEVAKWAKHPEALNLIGKMVQSDFSDYELEPALNFVGVFSPSYQAIAQKYGPGAEGIRKAIRAGEAVGLPQPLSFVPVEAGRLEKEIQSRLRRVAELEWLSDYGKRKGLNIALIKDSAVDFANYVRTDLAREGGDWRLPSARYTYASEDVWSPGHEIQLSVSAPLSEIATLTNDYAKHFQALNGSATSIHVNSAHGPGIPLSGKPEAFTQGFFKDIDNGYLPFSGDPVHSPSIALKRVSLALENGLKLSPSERDGIRAIFDKPSTGNAHIDPSQNDNLITEARSMLIRLAGSEYADSELKQLNIKNFLQTIGGDAHQPGTLGSLLEREPLRTHGIGRLATEDPRHGMMPGLKPWQMARAANVSTVHIRTDDPALFEALRKGQPSVFISRQGRPFENAPHGNAFYTRAGEGMPSDGPGVLIRFKVLPLAMEGVDFTRAGDDVMILNRAVLQVLPESFEPTPESYLHYLRNARSEGQRIIVRAMGRSLRSRMRNGGVEDVSILKKALETSTDAGLDKNDFVQKELSKFVIFLQNLHNNCAVVKIMKAIEGE